MKINILLTILFIYMIYIINYIHLNPQSLYHQQWYICKNYFNKYYYSIIDLKHMDCLQL